MKKVIFLSLIVLTISSVGFAQNSKSFYRSSYESRNSGSWSGDHSILSLGYGFANQFYPGGAYGNRFSLGPIYVKYEHGFLRDDVGLGGSIALAHAWVKAPNDVKYNVTAFSIAALGYYHFNKLIPVEALDVYAGLGLSFWSRSGDTNDYYNYSESNVYPVVKVGARYYVKPRFGFYGEVGYDQMSSLNLGVTFKF
jgi:hypothetical protein